MPELRQICSSLAPFVEIFQLVESDDKISLPPRSLWFFQTKDGFQQQASEGIRNRQPTGQPTGQPTDQPTCQPTGQPTCQPTDQPTGEPKDQPTCQPTDQPTGEPKDQPTCQPTDQPTGHCSIFLSHYHCSITLLSTTANTWGSVSRVNREKRANVGLLEEET